MLPRMSSPGKFRSWQCSSKEQEHALCSCLSQFGVSLVSKASNEGLWEALSFLLKPACLFTFSFFRPCYLRRKYNETNFKKRRCPFSVCSGDFFCCTGYRQCICSKELHLRLPDGGRRKQPRYGNRRFRRFTFPWRKRLQKLRTLLDKLQPRGSSR